MYTFSWFWFFIGLLVVVGGATIMRYYDKISEFMGTGISGYRKWKIGALVMCCIGLLMMFNLHMFVFGLIADLIFGGVLKN